MIVTRYLSAAGVALFMMGVIAGYALNGSAKAAAYKMTVMVPAPTAKTPRSLNDETQAIIVAVDGVGPGCLLGSADR